MFIKGLGVGLLISSLVLYKTLTQTDHRSVVLATWYMRSTVLLLMHPIIGMINTILLG